MQIDPALNHINLMTDNMDRLIRFYGDVIGFKPDTDRPFPSTGPGSTSGKTPSSTWWKRTRPAGMMIRL